MERMGCHPQTRDRGWGRKGSVPHDAAEDVGITVDPEKHEDMAVNHC